MRTLPPVTQVPWVFLQTAAHDLAQHSLTQLCTKRDLVNLARVCAGMSPSARWKLLAPSSARCRITAACAAAKPQQKLRSAPAAGRLRRHFLYRNECQSCAHEPSEHTAKRALPRPPRSRARAFVRASLSTAVSESIVKSGNQRILSDFRVNPDPDCYLALS